MNDTQLRQDVLDELAFEPSVDAANIGVAAENGVVTLTGHVPSYWQKTTVERAVWRVKGVKALAEEIKVRLPNDRKDSDDQIAERAWNILAWDSSVPKPAIRIMVRDGWVTLSGEVTWQFQRSAAESAVRKLTGVMGVINSITIKPTIQTQDVRKLIEDALKRHAEVEARQIDIDVRDHGSIILQGKVDNWEERRAVERAVWSAPGVTHIDDRITIG
jgi:osmotically-inducible protein OsmY